MNATFDSFLSNKEHIYVHISRGENRKYILEHKKNAHNDGSRALPLNDF